MNKKYLLSTILFLPFLLATQALKPPEFRKISNHRARKDAFIAFLAPQVNSVNTEILKERSKVISLHEKFVKKQTLSSSEETWLSQLAVTHNVKDFAVTQKKSWDELILRVDIIPLSLAIAQAANESGWGTSKFAVVGNNYFGHFCNQPGCGIVPGPKGKENASEAKIFTSAFESVKSYIRNLNSHKAYDRVRQIRAKMRKISKPLEGKLLADGLELYSTRGKAYVRDLKKMINSHGLEKVVQDYQTS